MSKKALKKYQREMEKINKMPTLEISEKQKRRMLLEEWSHRAMFGQRYSIEGGDITETKEGEYLVHLGWETLDRLYDIGETRDVKVAVLIREAVALWLEKQALEQLPKSK